MDPLTFFPIGQTRLALRQTASAKAACAQCPVSQECLEFAILTFQTDGIWGGLGEDERRLVKRARRAKLQGENVRIRNVA